MRKLLFTLLLLGTLEAGGTKTYRNECFETLTFDGNLILDRCDFLSELVVEGELFANHCRIDLATVNGKTVLKECLVRAPAACRGEFEAHHTIFAQPIEVQTKLATFDRCLLEEIIVRKVRDHKGSQIVHITGGTLLKGNITFEGKNGEVYVSKDSRFMGAVIGGKIIPFAK